MKKFLFLLLLPLLGFGQFNPVQFYEFGSQKKQFISTWDTTKVSTGSSTATQVKLPLVSTGTYNMTVDWGDGIKTTVTTATYNTANTHTYSVAGTYEIKISGTCVGWQFNNTGDRLKFLSVKTWGSLRISTAGFFGCANLSLTSVEDVLNLKGFTSLHSLFTDCTALTTINRINEWDTSAITNMYGVFRNCSNFNDNIGNWNVSSVTAMSTTNIGTFANCTKFNNGGSDSIKNWVTTNNTTFVQMFSGCSAFNQPIGSWDIQNTTTLNSMFLSAVAFNQNLGTWNVTKVVDFGAMFSSAYAFNNGGSPSIGSWVLNTTSNISMSGMFNGAIAFNQNLNSWNVSKVVNMQTLFRSCPFNNGLASGVGGTMTWTTSSLTAMQSTFEINTAFNQNISGWDVSKVTTFGTGTSSNMGTFQGATSFNNGLASGVNGTLPWTINTASNVTMMGMFNGATSFNCSLPWDMSKVTTVANMFLSASKFNQSLSWNLPICTSFASTFNGATVFNNGLASGVSGTLSWTINNTSSVDMSSTFFNATAFNQDIGGWNVQRVTSMSQMLRGTKFNHSLSSWDVSSVADFSNMLAFCPFNNGLASGVAGTFTWTLKNTGSVTMAGMFNGNTAFNQDIGGWNVQRVTSLASCFSSNSSFNNGGSASIGSWVTSSLLDISSCFQNTPFNQPLNSWDVSKVTNMGLAFYGSPFNQPLNSWVTSSVSNMSQMFTGVNGFNQDIGMWNVSNVTNFTNFMNSKTSTNFSSANLDAIYNGWSSRPVKPSLIISFGTAKYTASGVAGRAILTNTPNLWNITDGGI